MADSQPELDAAQARRLLEAGRALVAELDLEVVLERLLDVARELTGARYAAIGVLDAERRGLERFLTAGVSADTRAAIGELPRGRGILGLLIEDPRPLILDDFSTHPRSYGLPAGHPPMHSFLGVPVVIRGEPWGNLYLTEKAGGPFGESDIAAVTVLSDWAAIAIDHAHLYRSSVERSDELERAVEALEATTAIARALGSETDLQRVLELIVKRGRALVRARTLLLLLAEGDQLTVAAGAGQIDQAGLGAVVPVAGSVAGAVLRSGQPERIADVPARLAIADEALGVPGAETGLAVPLCYRDRPLGVLLAFDRLDDEPGFGDREEQLLLAFAASAATAVATAQTVESDRLLASLRSAEQERSRWARELHDETLQGLAALNVLLAGGLRAGGPELEDAARTAGAQIDAEIANLRALITELRPAALDQLGLAAALDGLAHRARTVEGLEVELEVETDDAGLSPDLRTGIYRLIQESLTNIGKHAGATTVRIAVRDDGAAVTVSVADDGRGFDPAAPSEGFGMAGMRERAALAGGQLEVVSSPAGTTISARLPR